jgi:hypothetical protein
MYQFREYRATTRREMKLQGSWCQTPYIGAANGDCAREPICHGIGRGETIMVRRAQLKNASTRQFRPVRITAMPGSNLVAFTARGEAVVPPIIRAFIEMRAMATERAAGVPRVFYYKNQTALLVYT